MKIPYVIGEVRTDKNFEQVKSVVEETNVNLVTAMATKADKITLINTTSPLAGGGNLSQSRTLSIGGLSTFGTANYILGANSGATALEYKQLIAGAGITISHAAGQITISTHGMVFITPTDITSSLTWDETWRDLDCSTWVPSGATAAIFSIYVVRTSDTLVNFSWRRKGDTNALINITSDPIGSSNYRAGGMAIIPLDGDRKCQYNAPNNAGAAKFAQIYGYIT